MEKPRVLILGGCGFVGRNLVVYLTSKDLAKEIRVVDKVPPQVAWLNDEEKAHFNSPNVSFISANLINPESCKNAFRTESSWDLVVNCAGETKAGHTDPVYNEGILKLSLNCANEAAEHKVNRYIELSSGNMNSEKGAHKEDGNIEPWTFVATWKRKVEQQLADIPNLKYTILRLPRVYGVGDKAGLTPRLLGAAIYRQLGETMKLLWSADLRINTVHVSDVCSAIMFVAGREDTIGEIYNVVDDADSTQGSISNLLIDLYNIKVDYYGNIFSNLVDLAGAADDANDKHIVPWADACRKDSIENTPLSPHMDIEMLLHKHLRLDGTKLKNLGFQLNVRAPTVNQLRQVLDNFAKIKIFPHSLLPQQ